MRRTHYPPTYCNVSIAKTIIYCRIGPPKWQVVVHFANCILWEIRDVCLFKIMGHSWPLFLYFRLFNTIDSKMFNIIFCRWQDLNRGPLELEVTGLPNEPQPLSMFGPCQFFNLIGYVDCVRPRRVGRYISFF